MDFLTTSIAPEYTPFSAVCIRTLTRSNGCPTNTAHTPPIPPAASERKLDTVCFEASTISSFICTTVWVLVESEEEDDGATGFDIVEAALPRM